MVDWLREHPNGKRGSKTFGTFTYLKLASKKNEKRMVFGSCPLAKYCFLLFLFVVIVRRTTMNTRLKCNLKILNNLLPPKFN